ncbi:MAG: PGF-pre-PGF domain-containing protein [Methanosarcinales archaeon]|nr:MAG: PGF-pre-PGF domain-containing protein [Methanosarcinales archaeon]
MSKTITINGIILLGIVAIFVPNVQAYPINVTDDFGYKMTITNVTRIVSLAPSNTEILFVVGAGTRVEGVTIYCDYPPEVQNISKIGGFANVNIEAIINLTPDLVLAAYGNGEQTINQLRNLNLTVVALNPKTTEDIIRNIQLVGNITENDDNASTIAENMKQEIKNITDVTNGLSENQKARVLYIVWDNPLYSAGSGTYAHDLIGKAGGINIVESSGWPVISLENAVEKNPQIIITSSMGGESSRMRDRIMNNTVLAQTDAVRNGRVYAISDPNIIERSGPRITQGLKELYEYIAPVKPATTQTSSAGSGSGSSGVITSEPYENIVKAERHERNLIYNSPVIYTFSAPEHGIYEISVTGKANEIDVVMRIEALKSTSKSVAIPPPGIIYKNLNILAGTEKIKEAIIRSKVENSWITSNNLAGSDVKMAKWDGGKWNVLETMEKNKDSTHTYFEAKTDGFSSFAIVAMPAPTPTYPTETPKPTPASPGFEFILAVLLLLAVYLKRRL